MLLLTSCKSTYQFCQIYETKPDSKSQEVKEKDGVLSYEDANCIVSYYLWSEGGNASFVIYNKTNDILHVNLSESFFILNGMAHNYYQEREWSSEVSNTSETTISYGYGSTYANSNTNAWFNSSIFSTNASIVSGYANTTSSGGTYGTAWGSSVGSSSSYGTGGTNSYTSILSSRKSRAHTTSSSKSNRTTWKEQKIISIPPMSGKLVLSYNITNKIKLDCELTRFPEESDRMSFDQESSPIHFANYISYHIGENQQKTVINNGFYVSSISNHALPSIVEFRERKEPCENMKDVDYKEPLETLYDKFLRDGVCTLSSSFYIEYETRTHKKLYKKGTSYYIYSYSDGAYVKSFKGRD